MEDQDLQDILVAFFQAEANGMTVPVVTNGIG